MRGFEYVQPRTKQEALGLLSSTWGDSEILAGGTDLVGLMKDAVVTPKRVVDIKAIPELRVLELLPKTGLRLGALVTLDELAENAVVRKHYPILAQAAGAVASPQIRNRATVGGDLCQRPRCWYFRAGFGLLGQDEKGASLVEQGDNRHHAVLGNAGPALFVSPSSLAVALEALGASLRVLGRGGEREVAIAEFFTAPKKAGDREHARAADEIVAEVRIPPLGTARCGFYEVREHAGPDWPLASAAAAITLSGGSVAKARIVLGHVAPVPWRSKEAEAAITGKPLDAASASAAADAAVAGARSLGDNAHKIQLARVAVKRALQAAQGGAA